MPQCGHRYCQIGSRSSGTGQRRRREAELGPRRSLLGEPHHRVLDRKIKGDRQPAGALHERQSGDQNFEAEQCTSRPAGLPGLRRTDQHVHCTMSKKSTS